MGGLCLSITENYNTYDIGANYVTMEYTEWRKIAREVGAQMYFEDPYTALYVPPDGKKPEFRDFLTASRTDQATGKVVPIVTFIGLTLKYLWLRLKLGRVIDPPSFEHLVDEAPELAVPFATWLSDNGLEPLTRLFEIPVTIMGYGHLTEIPAPYVLKYIGPKTFVPMLFFGVPLLRYIMPWPRRFLQGFQRVWERVSWDLNVRLDIAVTCVERTPNGVKIKFTQPDQVLDNTAPQSDELDVDYVMLGCPLNPSEIEKFMPLDNAERALLSEVKVHTYCMFTATVANLELPTPIAATFPLTKTGTPWAMTQQWKSKGSFVTQFYVQLPGETFDVKPGEDYKDQVRASCVDLVGRLGGSIEPDVDAWRTFDAFPYFQHVTSQTFKSGWYKRLEAQQGVNRTFYLGGPTSFQLVEPIVRYSKWLRGKHFPAA